MRITLVSVHPYPSPQAIPLANAFLQSYLSTIPQAASIEVQRVDFFLGQEISDCIAQIEALRADLIGFSLYVWNRDMCRELAARLRQHLPKIVVFAGGPEATADPAGLLGGATFDFLVSGEGELPFASACARLADGGDISDIPGIVIRTGTSITLCPPTPLSDLDAIPSPWLNGSLDAGSYPGILWQLSRGCGFSCDFCFDSRDSHGVRRFSLERIEAELRHFVEQDVSQVFVLDSTFNQDQKRAKTILRMIRKIAPQIHFHFEVRSEFIDHEMAQLFAAITCSLQIGLQSSDPQVLKQVGRVFRQDDFVSRTMLLNDTGATFGFDLMYGLPGDSLAGFRDSLDFALGLYPNHLDIFPLAVLPGTALALRTDSIGLNHLQQPPYTLLSSPGFSIDDMAAAQKLAAACDIFYTRGRAVAWFNGMLHAIGRRPTEFLQSFGEWLGGVQGAGIIEIDLTDGQIWRLQRDFLAELFSTKKLKRFLPALLDLVDYHYHYAAALLTPPRVIPPQRRQTVQQMLSTKLRRTAETHLATFHYEILEVLDTGAADVREISSTLQQSGSWGIIYPTAEGVFTESVSEAYFRLLEGLDGKQSAGEVVAGLGISAAEAVEFLDFALQEGIIEHCPHE